MSTGFEEITNPVKLVIWDLDETFWHGTLSEGGADPVVDNIAVVNELVDRGIMCSICSKNDFADAQKRLVEIGIWDKFVFAHIDWTAKGQAIANMLSAMQLRADNVVFLDDNPMNLAEAKFFNEGLMCALGTQDLTAMLDLAALKGKNDREHTRLKQYKLMETRQIDMDSKGGSNEAFLRESYIRIKVITDIDDKMDRVLEILNRTNQLNFTKVRANSEQERASLDAELSTSGMHAGLIHVQDRYGDYGIVGFFCVRTKYNGTRVHHFAFSCRTLNMGVEQWVWNYLGRPEFQVVGPVANPIQSFAEIDWITEVDTFDDAESTIPNRRLCLVGGCDLLQVSFYCGTNRDEFVNKQDEENYLVRFDDVGFFLNPRKELRHNRILKSMPSWQYSDMIRLDDSLAKSEIILLSLFYSVPTDNIFTFGGREFGGEYLITVPVRTLRKLMQSDKALWFAKTFFHRRPSLGERLEMTRKCMQRAVDLASADAKLFILSAAVERGQQADRNRSIRDAYNLMCKDFCAQNQQAHFVDIDTLLNPEEFADSDHYTRTGYFKIAEFVNTTTNKPLETAGAGQMNG